MVGKAELIWRKKMKTLFTAFLVFSMLTVFGQKENPLIREGNEQYRNGNVVAAEKSYREALKKNKVSDPAQFNLGDALYKQEKYEDAEKQFKSLAESKKTPAERSRIYHNLGNTYLQQKKYEESINAYKQALKSNPSDDDTRYNLAYAQAKLQQQKQQQDQDKNKDNKDKDKKDKKDNKDNKDKKDDKKNDDKDKNKDQDKNQDKDPKEDQQPKQEKPKMNEQDARRMLEAINQEDKKIQDKLKKEKGKGRQVQIEKDW